MGALRKRVTGSLGEASKWGGERHGGPLMPSYGCDHWLAEWVLHGVLSLLRGASF